MKRSLAVALLGALWCAGGGPAHAGPYTVSFISTGGLSELANDINNSGTVVGQSDTRGFVYSGGKVTLYQDPYDSLNLFGLNNAGVAIGYSSTLRSFMLANGVMTAISVPGVPDFIASDINDSGQMVGSSYSVGANRIVLVSGSSVTTIAIPGASTFSGTKINDSGAISGNYQDAAGKFHAFLYANGTLTPLDVPGADGTTAGGLNDRGEVVGTYGFNWSGPPDPRPPTYGFIYSGGQFQTFPLSFGSDFYLALNGINDSGVLAGAEGERRVVNAFTATPAPVPEPAGAPVFAAGLLLLGAVAARGRAYSADRSA